MAILFIVSCAEVFGLFVYLNVYNHLDATACCGIIAHSDEYQYDDDVCNERYIDDDSLSWTDVATSSGSTVRICTVNGHRCDTVVADDALSSCFHTESDYAELCGGWAGLLDSEHNAGSEARLAILISLAIMSLDILLAISELIQWRSECKGAEVKEWCCIRFIRCCLDCRCLWMGDYGKGWSYFMKLAVWIYMYNFMNTTVEGALEKGYYGEGYGGYSDDAYRGIAEEAEDVCDLNGNGFLTLKYHTETPASVDNGVYGLVTDVGLALAIIQFLIGFGFSYCAHARERNEEDDNGKVTQIADLMANKIVQSTIQSKMAKMGIDGNIEFAANSCVPTMETQSAPSDFAAKMFAAEMKAAEMKDVGI